jgi:hypothetical protein
VKAHSQQPRVETRHMIYHWKGITLTYITYRPNFPFNLYIIIETDKEVTTMDFGHLGDVQFVPFVD